MRSSGMLLEGRDEAGSLGHALTMPTVLRRVSSPTGLSLKMEAASRRVLRTTRDALGLRPAWSIPKGQQVGADGSAEHLVSSYTADEAALQSMQSILEGPAASTTAALISGAAARRPCPLHKMVLIIGSE